MAGKIDRRAIMEQTIKAIQKKLPDMTIAQYKDFKGGLDVQTISTGSLVADSVMGGGWAKGRINCVVGHTSAGKTSLALTACAELQKEMKAKDEVANILYVDAEAAIDPKYAKTLGVDLDSEGFYLTQPDNGEQGYEAAEMFIRSGVADLVIIDSVAAMIPKAMFETELGDQAQIGMGARLDSQGISRLFGPAQKTGCTVILINQWKKAVKVNAYDRTDGISGNYYMPGGETFKFYLTQLVEVQRVGKIYEKDENGIDQLVTNQIRCRTLKNKIAPPNREGDYFLTFSKGLDKAQEIIEMGILSGDVIRTGRSLYSIKGDENNTFNGRPKFVAYLNENPDVVDKVSKNIRAYLQGLDGEDIHRQEAIDTETEEVDTDPNMADDDEEESGFDPRKDE